MWVDPHPVPPWEWRKRRAIALQNKRTQSLVWTIMPLPLRGKMLKHQFAIALAVGAFSGCFAWASPCAAQTVMAPGGTPNQLPQNPQAGQLQLSLPTGGVADTEITPQTTGGFTGNRLISRPGMSLGSAGRGLPGMPGGPPLKAPVGAEDPSASYMRAPVIGPLFCDPSINIAC